MPILSSGASCCSNNSSFEEGVMACLCCCLVFALDRRGVSNQVQLSTYADCIGSDLTDLRDFLETHVDGERVSSMGLHFKGYCSLLGGCRQACQALRLSKNRDNNLHSATQQATTAGNLSTHN